MERKKDGYFTKFSIMLLSIIFTTSMLINIILLPFFSESKIFLLLRVIAGLALVLGIIISYKKGTFKLFGLSICFLLFLYLVYYRIYFLKDLELPNINENYFTVKEEELLDEKNGFTYLEKTLDNFEEEFTSKTHKFLEKEKLKPEDFFSYKEITKKGGNGEYVLLTGEELNKKLLNYENQINLVLPIVRKANKEIEETISNYDFQDKIIVSGSSATFNGMLNLPGIQKRARQSNYICLYLANIKKQTAGLSFCSLPLKLSNKVIKSKTTILGLLITSIIEKMSLDAINSVSLESLDKNEVKDYLSILNSKNSTGEIIEDMIYMEYKYTSSFNEIQKNSYETKGFVYDIPKLLIKNYDYNETNKIIKYFFFKLKKNLKFKEGDDIETNYDIRHNILGYNNFIDNYFYRSFSKNSSYNRFWLSFTRKNYIGREFISNNIANKMKIKSAIKDLNEIEKKRKSILEKIN